MRVLELFAGAGGGILGGLLLGHKCIGAVENEPYCQRVLMARQADGVLPWFPIYSDIREFDGRPYRGVVDIVSGGYPCTGHSHAGKGHGHDDARSGLWFDFVRVVREIRPRFVFVENSPRLATTGLDRVVADLLSLRYRCIWTVLGARHVGAPHDRDRLWLLAHAYDAGQRILPIDGEVAEARTIAARDVPDMHGEQRKGRKGQERARRTKPGRVSWWEAEPGMARVAHGVAHQVERTRATGNGQVPDVHALAFRVLHKRLIGAP